MGGSGSFLLGGTSAYMSNVTCYGQTISLRFFTDNKDDKSGLIFYEYSLGKSFGEKLLEGLSKVKLPLPGPGPLKRLPRF